MGPSHPARFIREVVAGLDFQAVDGTKMQTASSPASPTSRAHSVEGMHSQSKRNDNLTENGMTLGSSFHM